MVGFSFWVHDRSRITDGREGINHNLREVDDLYVQWYDGKARGWILGDSGNVQGR